MVIEYNMRDAILRKDVVSPRSMEVNGHDDCSISEHILDFPIKDKPSNGYIE